MGHPRIPERNEIEIPLYNDGIAIFANVLPGDVQSIEMSPFGIDR
jgi:hypothetical protein